MARSKILALVMAGGAGGRMDLLTDARAKPALPYAAVYRLIDIPLSHCVHSEINDVWVFEQFQAHTLNDYLANGRPWDLDRTYGGLRVLPPETGLEEGGWHQGNADAIYRSRRFIREFAPDLLLVLSSDHIYRLDYRDVVDAHRQGNADVTLVTTQVPIEQASRFGTVQTGPQGKVTEFAYKPETPKSNTVTTEVFVYDAKKLLDTIDELAEDARDEHDEVNLQDFGHLLLPRMVQLGRVYSYPLEGYWRDVGTIDSYWQSHMDLLEDSPPFDLDARGWPILTYGAQRMPARVFSTARIDRSLIAPGSIVRGQVERSVLGPGVVVEAGAAVRNSIVFANTVIRPDAVVEYAIVDSDAEIGQAAGVGGANDKKSEIALVGLAAHVPAGDTVPAGGRFKAE